ncbi:MAG: superoxide dismutase [Hamadaea sp.]|uniref:superoxide dismutase n=1 Tax=Hamadaea sp. TaxID=2024425 RepID=UPI0017E64BD1|nr:superoxide dismutase [Hamadaea sp.]NUR72458.1 superoxide dismutase [Hamadaea sp.]NUT22226.1 superoxide dismutase [Hamadaea sp.]
MRRRTMVAALAAAPLAGLLGGTSAEAAGGHATLPEVIDLPDGWNPEGIAVSGTNFYVGSIATGSIYRGSLLTGRGGVFIPGPADGHLIGLEIDRYNRIWACTGPNGGAVVYDAGTGAKLAEYQFGGGFVNDAIATEDAVYFTDSPSDQLFVVPLGRGGRLPDPSAAYAITLPGGLGESDAFNNGIETTPDGRRLLIVQMVAGRLFAFDPRHGTATQIDVGGASLLNGDGMIRRGRTLYICRNSDNIISKFELHGDTAMLLDEITDPRLQVPATIALFGSSVYAVNARFDVDPAPDVTYNVVRLPA